MAFRALNHFGTAVTEPRNETGLMAPASRTLLARSTQQMMAAGFRAASAPFQPGSVALRLCPCSGRACLTDEEEEAHAS